MGALVVVVDSTESYAHTAGCCCCCCCCYWCCFSLDISLAAELLSHKERVSGHTAGVRSKLSEMKVVPNNFMASYDEMVDSLSCHMTIT